MIIIADRMLVVVIMR